MNIKIPVCLILLVSLVVCAHPVFADEAEAKKCLKGIEVLTGFGSAKLRDKATYHPITFYLDLDFDLKPQLEKINFNPPVMFDFVLEPFASYSYQPDNNAEIGNNFLVKIGFVPETWKLQPYFKGGVGFIYITQHTREQGTQFNFNEYAGLGLHYFLNKRTAITAEYRYRHLSNASIKSPNRGIDTNYGIVGVSHLF